MAISAGHRFLSVAGVAAVLLLALGAEGDSASQGRGAVVAPAPVVVDGAAARGVDGAGFSFGEWLRGQAAEKSVLRFHNLPEFGAADTLGARRGFWREVVSRAGEDVFRRTKGDLLGLIPGGEDVGDILVRHYNGEDVALGEWRKLRQAHLAFYGNVDRAIAGALSRATAERLDFVERAQVDVRTSVGDRKGHLGVDAAGALRQRADDVIGWQARGAIGEQSAKGANLGLFYRRVVAGGFLGGGEGLAGANVFVDYERNKDAGGFWRWSLGGELKTRLVDFSGNYYAAITDAKTIARAGAGRRTYYTRGGFDIDAVARVPSVEWAQARVGHFHFKGKHGDADAVGTRMGLDLLPGGGWTFGMNYDTEEKELGGNVRYEHYFGVAPKSAARAAATYNPRAHFFDAVNREYRQRIGFRSGATPVNGAGANVSSIDDGVELVVNGTPKGSEAPFMVTLRGTVENGVTLIHSGGKLYTVFPLDTEQDISVIVRAAGDVVLDHWNRDWALTLNVGTASEATVELKDAGRTWVLVESAGVLERFRGQQPRDIVSKDNNDTTVTINLVGTRVAFRRDSSLAITLLEGMVTIETSLSVSVGGASEPAFGLVVLGEDAQAVVVSPDEFGVPVTLEIMCGSENQVEGVVQVCAGESYDAGSVSYANVRGEDYGMFLVRIPLPGVGEGQSIRQITNRAAAVEVAEVMKWSEEASSYQLAHNITIFDEGIVDGGIPSASGFDALDRNHNLRTAPLFSISDGADGVIYATVSPQNLTRERTELAWAVIGVDFEDANIPDIRRTVWAQIVGSLSFDVVGEVPVFHPNRVRGRFTMTAAGGTPPYRYTMEPHPAFSVFSAGDNRGVVVHQAEFVGEVVLQVAATDADGARIWRNVRVTAKAPEFVLSSPQIVGMYETGGGTVTVTTTGGRLAAERLAEYRAALSLTLGTIARTGGNHSCIDGNIGGGAFEWRARIIDGVAGHELIWRGDKAAAGDAAREFVTGAQTVAVTVINVSIASPQAGASCDGGANAATVAFYLAKVAPPPLAMELVGPDSIFGADRDARRYTVLQTREALLIGDFHFDRGYQLTPRPVEISIVGGSEHFSITSRVAGDVTLPGLRASGLDIADTRRTVTVVADDYHEGSGNVTAQIVVHARAAEISVEVLGGFMDKVFLANTQHTLATLDIFGGGGGNYNVRLRDSGTAFSLLDGTVVLMNAASDGRHEAVIRVAGSSGHVGLLTLTAIVGADLRAADVNVTFQIDGVPIDSGEVRLPILGGNPPYSVTIHGAAIIESTPHQGEGDNSVHVFGGPAAIDEALYLPPGRESEGVLRYVRRAAGGTFTGSPRVSTYLYDVTDSSTPPQSAQAELHIRYVASYPLSAIVAQRRAAMVTARTGRVSLALLKINGGLLFVNVDTQSQCGDGIANGYMAVSGPTTGSPLNECDSAQLAVNNDYTVFYDSNRRGAEATVVQTHTVAVFGNSRAEEGVELEYVTLTFTLAPHIKVSEASEQTPVFTRGLNTNIIRYEGARGVAPYRFLGAGDDFVIGENSGVLANTAALGANFTNTVIMVSVVDAIGRTATTEATLILTPSPFHGSSPLLLGETGYGSATITVTTNNGHRDAFQYATIGVMSGVLNGNFCVDRGEPVLQVDDRGETPILLYQGDVTSSRYREARTISMSFVQVPANSPCPEGRPGELAYTIGTHLALVDPPLVSAFSIYNHTPDARFGSDFVMTMREDGAFVPGVQFTIRGGDPRGQGVSIISAHNGFHFRFPGSSYYLEAREETSNPPPPPQGRHVIVVQALDRRINPTVGTAPRITFTVQLISSTVFPANGGIAGVSANAEETLHTRQLYYLAAATVNVTGDYQATVIGGNFENMDIKTNAEKLGPGAQPTPSDRVFHFFGAASTAGMYSMTAAVVWEGVPLSAVAITHSVITRHPTLWFADPHGQAPIHPIHANPGIWTVFLDYNNITPPARYRMLRSGHPGLRLDGNSGVLSSGPNFRMSNGVVAIVVEAWDAGDVRITNTLEIRRKDPFRPFNQPFDVAPYEDRRSPGRGRVLFAVSPEAFANGETREINRDVFMGRDGLGGTLSVQTNAGDEDRQYRAATFGAGKNEFAIACIDEGDAINDMLYVGDRPRWTPEQQSRWHDNHLQSGQLFSDSFAWEEKARHVNYRDGSARDPAERALYLESLRPATMTLTLNASQHNCYSNKSDYVLRDLVKMPFIFIRYHPPDITLNIRHARAVYPLRHIYGEWQPIATLMASGGDQRDGTQSGDPIGGVSIRFNIYGGTYASLFSVAVTNNVSVLVFAGGGARIQAGRDFNLTISATDHHQGSEDAGQTLMVRAENESVLDLSAQSGVLAITLPINSGRRGEHRYNHTVTRLQLAAGNQCVEGLEYKYLYFGDNPNERVATDGILKYWDGDTGAARNLLMSSTAALTMRMTIKNSGANPYCYLPYIPALRKTTVDLVLAEPPAINLEFGGTVTMMRHGDNHIPVTLQLQSNADLRRLKLTVIGDPHFGISNVAGAHVLHFTLARNLWRYTHDTRHFTMRVTTDDGYDANNPDPVVMMTAGLDYAHPTLSPIPAADQWRYFGVVRSGDTLTVTTNRGNQNRNFRIGVMEQVRDGWHCFRSYRVLGGESVPTFNTQNVPTLRMNNLYFGNATPVQQSRLNELRYWDGTPNFRTDRNDILNLLERSRTAQTISLDYNNVKGRYEGQCDYIGDRRHFGPYAYIVRPHVTYPVHLALVHPPDLRIEFARQNYAGDEIYRNGSPYLWQERPDGTLPPITVTVLGGDRQPDAQLINFNIGNSRHFRADAIGHIRVTSATMAYRLVPLLPRAEYDTFEPRITMQATDSHPRSVDDIVRITLQVTEPGRSYVGMDFTRETYFPTISYISQPVHGNRVIGIHAGFNHRYGFVSPTDPQRSYVRLSGDSAFSLRALPGGGGFSEVLVSSAVGQPYHQVSATLNIEWLGGNEGRIFAPPIAMTVGFWNVPVSLSMAVLGSRRAQIGAAPNAFHFSGLTMSLYGGGGNRIYKVIGEENNANYRFIDNALGLPGLHVRFEVRNIPPGNLTLTVGVDDDWTANNPDPRAIVTLDIRHPIAISAPQSPIPVLIGGAGIFVNAVNLGLSGASTNHRYQVIGRENDNNYRWVVQSDASSARLQIGNSNTYSPNDRLTLTLGVSDNLPHNDPDPRTTVTLRFRF